MSNRFTNLVRRLSNTAVVWGFAGAGVRTFGGVLLLPLLVKFVPSDELGVWYVFVSMSSFVLMLNAGLSQALTRGMAYLWAGATELKTFGVSTLDHGAQQTEPNVAGIRDLLATLRIFYAAMGAGCFLLFAIAGTGWIWHITGPLEVRAGLCSAWLLYAAGFSLNFSCAFWMPFLAGINHVRDVERVMAAASVIHLSVSAIGLLLGFGVWSLVVGHILMGLVNWSAARFLFLGVPTAGGEGWRGGRAQAAILGRIWPTAWRTAACASGAYLGTPASVFVCSAFCDLSTTASLGLTLQLLTKIISVSVIWVRVKIPEFSGLRAKQKHQALAALFASRMRLSLITAFLSTVMLVLSLPIVFEKIGANTRLLPGWPLLVLCVCSALRLQQSQYAMLVLTENQNPFARRALVTGLLVFATSWMAARVYGIWGLLVPMLLIPGAYNNWSIVCRGVSGLQIDARAYWDLFFLNRVRPRGDDT